MAYDNIKIDKSLYATGKSFTQALEAIDPSENYKGTELDGLDAFERQLKRFDIKVSGADSDMVSKFFKTSDSAALFPEFVARTVKQGIIDGANIDNITAVTTNIDSLDYRSIDVTGISGNSFSQLNEGAEFSETQLGVKSTLTRLEKFGTMLSASYEALKFQKIDVLAIALRKLGQAIARDEFDRAIHAVFYNDDVENIQSDNKELTYDDLVTLWSALAPYKMTTIVCSRRNVEAILKMPEFRDANASLDFHGTGRLVTPFGAEIIMYEGISDKVIYALDKNYAIEKVQATGVVTEYDKLINRQIERVAISTITGFSAIFTEASKFLALKDE